MICKWYSESIQNKHLMIRSLKKDRRVVHRVTTNGTTSDNEWQRVTMSGTTSNNEWQRVVQRVTTNDNEWQRVVQRVTTNDNEWQRVRTSGTTSDKEWKWLTKSNSEWQWVTVSENSGTANGNGTVHFKERMIAIITMTKRDTLLLPIRVVK